MTRVQVRTILTPRDGVTGRDAQGRLNSLKPENCIPYHYVEVLVYEQENWYPLTHVARFEDRTRAERLAEAVRQKINEAWGAQYIPGEQDPLDPAAGSSGRKTDTFMGLDLDYWEWHYGISVPFSALQQPSKAKPYKVPA